MLVKDFDRSPAFVLPLPISEFLSPGSIALREIHRRNTHPSGILRAFDPSPCFEYWGIVFVKGR